MPVLHITESELARDLHSVLAQVRRGVEVVVEQDNLPVAVIRAARPQGRLISECVAIAEAHGTGGVPDEGFLRDVEKGIVERSRPWNPPLWD